MAFSAGTRSGVARVRLVHHQRVEGRGTNPVPPGAKVRLLAGPVDGIVGPVLPGAVTWRRPPTSRTAPGELSVGVPLRGQCRIVVPVRVDAIPFLDDTDGEVEAVVLDVVG